MKDLSTFTLGDLKDKVLFGSDNLKLSLKNLMIEFDSKIIYEYDQEMVDENDPDDQAEIALNKKRLLKTLADAKLQHQSTLQVQAQRASDLSECVIGLSLLVVPDLEVDFKIDLIKEGMPKKVVEKTTADLAKETKQVNKAMGKVEISSDDCLIDEDPKAVDKEGEFFLPQKRASATPEAG